VSQIITSTNYNDFFVISNVTLLCTLVGSMTRWLGRRS